MNTAKKEPWILTGYSLFAKEGPEGLKIEAIAKRVGISKSSFYHHFADVHIFTDMLLRFHLDRTKIIVQREKDCKSIEPELICVLLEYKQDLLFNRQLRIHRADKKFRKCVEASNRLTAHAISDIWGKDLGLNRESELVEMLLALLIENFYLQITEESLTYEWLSDYFKGLRTMGGELTKRMNLSR